MLSQIKNLFFPKICFACGNSISVLEKNICLECITQLPRTNFFQSKNNEVEKIFWGRIPIEKATSFLTFQPKGKVQKLIHQFKYKGQKELGVTLGELAANELQKQGFFIGINLIIPMPIHDLKKEKRGFNQSDFIAEGISNITGLEMELKNVRKVVNTSSQTKKGRFKRWKNVETTFQVSNPEELNGKHILLVDDVITTGSTIEACSLQLLKIPNLKISILSIAMTY